MEHRDDELIKFEADGAKIWYAAYGSGPAVTLLHGGLGNSRNWGYQVPSLLETGYCVIVIDSRGYGRSTRAVMDALRLENAA